VYVIATVRYRKSIDEVLKVVDAHRAYLGTPDAEMLAIRDHDPYVLAGVAQWELLPWNPVSGKENLDRA